MVINNPKLNFLNLIYSTVLLSVFFPYFNFFVENKLDLQGWFFIFCSLVLIINIKNVNFNKYYLFLLPQFVFTIFAFLLIYRLDHGMLDPGTNLKNNIKFLLVYCGFPITFFACSILIEKINFPRLLLIASLLWLIIGFLQMFYDSSMMNNYMGRFSEFGKDGRGYGSLSPEPSIYGLHCCLLMILSFSTKNYFCLLLNIIQIIFISQSATAITVCLFILTVFFFLNISIKKILVICIVLFFLFLNYNFILKLYLDYTLTLINKTRFHDILSQFLMSGFNILETDASINSRLDALKFSILSSYKNFFLPHGKFDSELKVLLLNPSRPVYEYTNNILSGFGGMVYELGFISIFFCFFIFSCAKKFFKNTILYIFFSLMLLITLLMPINLFTPAIALICALWSKKKYNDYN